MKLKIIILVLIWNLAIISAFCQNVTLYAGHPDTLGFSPTHTGKLNFYFNSPFGLAFDSKGNLWISNFDGCTISTICAQDGQVYSRTGNNSNG